MLVVSFNVNGIRARMHQLKVLVESVGPEIIGIQESKVQDVDFPEGAIRELGYHVVFHGQKTHYGVALMSKREMQDVATGFPTDGEDAQRRLIRGTYQTESGARIHIVNGYFPQGESRDHPSKFPGKRDFYANLDDLLRRDYKHSDRLIVMGDFNIAPQDRDIGIGDDNAKRWLRTGKCSFLPEERGWFQRLEQWGLSDTYRAKYPDRDDRFSWFDYRSRGFEREPKRGLRIDFIMATPPLLDTVGDAGIDYAMRASEKPSDHCPVWTAFDL